MKRNNILYVILACTMLLVSCNPSANYSKTTTSQEDDRPALEFSDADRTFGVVLEITSDSLMTCNNNFSGKDKDRLILDTTNPNFPDLFSKWFASMDSTQINRLKTGSELHISVGDDVTEATIDKVKSNILKSGIKGISLSNF